MKLAQYDIMILVVLLAVLIPVNSSLFLYKAPNHSGFLQELSFSSESFCKDLASPETIGSVDTIGGCYVLYERKGCTGTGTQVFAREFAYHNMRKTVSSVGVCITTVDFYSGPDQTGYKESTKVFGTHDCIAVGKRWSKIPIGSVNTNGGCVLVHDGSDCNGHSLQLKAGTSTNENLPKWNFGTKIRSVGPCTKYDQWRSKEDSQIQFVLYSEYGKVYAGNSNQCGCQKINRGFDGFITSVATNGQCVRLYENVECSGQQIQLHPSIGFYHNLKEVGFSAKTRSVSNCHDGQTCRATPQTRMSKTPLFGQYMPQKDGVIIKIENVPPMDYFCELTRRCTGNRNFNCHALQNEGRCYCHASKKVTCDSGTFNHLNHKNFTEEKSFRFPIPGEFNGKIVYHMSSSYEAPFVKSCELSRRCSDKMESCQGEYGDIGGQGFQVGCYVKNRSIFAVAPAGAGIKARPSAVVDEDDEFSSLQ